MTSEPRLRNAPVAASGSAAADPGPGLGRRTFLRRLAVGGGVAGLAVGAPSLLAACGSSGGSGATALTLSTAVGGRQLVGMFDVRGDYAVTGIEQRLVLILSSDSGGAGDAGPADASPSRSGSQGEAPGGPDHARPRTPTEPRSPTTRWSPPSTGPAPGRSAPSSTASPARCRSSCRPPSRCPWSSPARPMPPVDTPTTADARGVDPICTADPPCPLHDVTLAAALAAHEPVALLVGSPAYCQVGTVCGPLLDLLLEQRAAHPHVHLLHAEPYVHPGASETQPAAGGVTPAVSDLGLTFEPSLFVVNANGVVTARLDDDFDREELGAALSAV